MLIDKHFFHDLHHRAGVSGGGSVIQGYSGIAPIGCIQRHVNVWAEDEY